MERWQPEIFLSLVTKTFQYWSLGDSSQGKDYSDADSSFRTEADPESDEAKKSTLVGSFLEGLRASASHARSYMNNEETGME